MHQNEEEKSPEQKERDLTSWENMQANYSAMMYIITEQQALIGKLLEELLKVGALNTNQLEKITGVYGNPEILNPVYNDLYARFASYFVKVKDVLANPEQYQPQTPFPEEEVIPSGHSNTPRPPDGGGSEESGGEDPAGVPGTDGEGETNPR